MSRGTDSQQAMIIQQWKVSNYIPKNIIYLHEKLDTKKEN